MTVYRVNNKITRRSDVHESLEKVFSSLKLITVLQKIREFGKYEDDLFIVTTEEKA